MDEPKKSNKTLWIIVGISAGVLVLCCCPGVMIGLLLPAVQKVREAAERTQRAKDLGEIGRAMHIFHDANKRMPKNVDELASSIPESRITDRIRNGEIEVVWNAVSLREEDRGTSSVLMAWFTTVDGSGNRAVLFMDASVETMSEDKFLNTPKVRTAGEKGKGPKQGQKKANRPAN